MASGKLIFFLFFLISTSFLSAQENIEIFNTNKNKAKIVILDKVTSKKTSHTVKIDSVYQMHSLDILVKRCVLDNSKGSLEVLAYVQVQESAIINKDKVYIFNGWMLSGHPSINAMEHPNYDIWIEGCF